MPARFPFTSRVLPLFRIEFLFNKPDTFARPPTLIGCREHWTSAFETAEISRARSRPHLGQNLLGRSAVLSACGH
jgi:hypothetical protein